MTRSLEDLSPEIKELLDQERSLPTVPAAVRERAVARARAGLTMGQAISMAQATSSTPSRAAMRTRWAAAVTLACVASAAIGATAYRAHMRPTPSSHPVAPAVHVGTPALAPTPTPAPASIPAAPSTETQASTVHRWSQSDAVRDELRLLRRARSAVAREDFAAALPPIVEHARRFKNGRLAEEREALRVKALVGLGRTQDARRAAASFEARFPNSVLLPAVNRMPVARP